MRKDQLLACYQPVRRKALCIPIVTLIGQFLAGKKVWKAD